MKLDRQEIIAVVVALREWFSMDHDARVAEYRQRAQAIQQALGNIPHCTFTPVSDERTLGIGVRIAIDERAVGKTAEQIAEALRNGDPSIWLHGSGGSIHISVPNLVGDDVQVVSNRLRELLT